MENPHQLALFFVAVVAFAVVSRRMTRRWITAPMVFVAFGFLLGTGGLGWLVFSPDNEGVKLLTEGTLVLVLFSDASRIQVRKLRHRLLLPGRLLGLGMPLTIASGTAAALWLFPGWSVAEGALVATVLAPTDAALGQAVVSDPAVPEPVREALTVESGLNDGIALPLVLLLLAVTTSQASSGTEWALFWVGQVVLGPLVGVLIGGLAGRLLDIARAKKWAESAAIPVGTLATVALCYLGAEAIGGNGFMAAFCGGLAFGAATSDVEGHKFLESEGQLLMWMVFTLLGCLYAWPVLQTASPWTYVYAILSITVIRMVPVAISLIGARLPWQTVGFIGWFGPRGLASIVFGLIVFEEEALSTRDAMFDVVIVTVLLSILLHGFTAAWTAARYGKWNGKQQQPVE